MEKMRTGLIIESMELASQQTPADVPIAKKEKYKSCSVTTVIIENDNEAKLLGREKGKYITVEFDKTYCITDSDFEEVVDVISKKIKNFSDKYFGKRIVVAGIGNRNITADSIGPKSIDKIIVTRALENTEFIAADCLGNVSAIAADVFGVTGIESAELIGGIAHVLKPALIVVIDALATTSLSRLCKTVQISDTSLVPGGGVDNARKSISPDNLNIPIISIGIPTVIDVCHLVKSSIDSEFGDSLVAMPARIDDATDMGAKLIAFSLNKALHNNLTVDDILKFLY